MNLILSNGSSFQGPTGSDSIQQLRPVPSYARGENLYYYDCFVTVIGAVRARNTRTIAVCSRTTVVKIELFLGD